MRSSQHPGGTCHTGVVPQPPATCAKQGTRAAGACLPSLQSSGLWPVMHHIRPLSCTGAPSNAWLLLLAAQRPSHSAQLRSAAALPPPLAGAPRLAIHRVADGEDDVVEIEVVHTIR